MAKVKTLDLDWDAPLHHKEGSDILLAGLDIWHEFLWHDQFSHNRSQFPGGQCVATFVRDTCPADKTPAVLLHARDDVSDGFRTSEKYRVFVLNVKRYRATQTPSSPTWLHATDPN